MTGYKSLRSPDEFDGLQAAREAFPLRLAAFEEYMWLDDRPSHPMCFHFRLRFRGKLDPQRLAEAVAATVQRQPLLSAVVIGRGRRSRWLPAPSPPRLQWREKAPRLGPIDLSREAGLRAFAWEGTAGPELLLQFHHSCCDGGAAAAVVQEALARYARREEDQLGDEPPVLDRHLLLRRDRLARGMRDLLHVLPRQFVGLAGVLQYATRRPQPLGAAAASAPLPDDYPSVVLRTLDRHQTERLRAAARASSVSVNDLLLRDVFVALQRWRTRDPGAGPRDWLRLSVPISLRTQLDAQMPAANRVSMVFLDRRLRDNDPAGLLRSVHEEMRLIRRFRLELTFLLSLKAMRRIPGALRHAVRPGHCAASCLVSNLGELFGRPDWPRADGCLRLGDAILEQVEVGAPNRPLQAAALVAYSYAGRLTLSLQYDSRAIAGEQAERLMDGLGEQLDRTLNSVDLADVR